MTNPVPGHTISTPYGKRGSYWSCNEDASGNGIHTGVDYAAASGTKVVAARPRKVVRLQPRVGVREPPGRDTGRRHP